MSATKRKYINIYIVVFAASILYFTVSIFFEEKRKDLEIAFLDVGQGDAVLITAPNGNRLLYDSGPPDRKVLSALRDELPLIGGSIDVYVASHPDSDHIGGFADVLPKYVPHVYLDAHTINLSSLFAALEEKLNYYGVARRTIESGAQIKLGGGVVVDVLAPEQNERKESLSTNDASAVLLVRYGESAVLLTGDMESKEEEHLIQKYGSALRANVLKAGHHGSKTSTSDALLKAVRPKYAVISVGENNKYGHPSSATISRIQSVGAEILQTKQSGSIHFRCNAKTCVPI